MQNRASATMFNPQQAQKNRAVAELIDAAVDKIVENSMSPKGLLILAIASLAVTGAGVWAVTKVGQFAMEDPVEDVKQEQGRAQSLWQSVATFFNENIEGVDYEALDAAGASYGCGM